MKKLKILLIALLTGVSSITFVAFNDDANFELSKNLDVFYTLIRELNLYYVDETHPAELIKKGIDAMLFSLDPYTTYIPESQMEDYRLMTTGQYGGVGALIRKEGDYVVITDPYEDFPAQKNGLLSGDIIKEINGKSIKGKPSSEVSELLKGQPGTELKILIQRPYTEEVIEKNIQREEIKINNVPYYGILKDSIGYINLSGFTENAYTEVRKALLDLKEKNKINALVLDLRGNPGGLLIEAVNISNLFLPKTEEIVSTRGKVKEWDKVYRGSFPPVDTEIPLVILVNSGSASASEIVAGAMQDLDRAVIIGQRTFGKGLVQTTRQLSYNAKLKVTTAKYYTPSGRCIQALDYSHRNEDGSVGRVPDSLITEFKTKNGRSVYDGGGIIPDLPTEPERLSNLSIELYTKNLIFDFATYYYHNHKAIGTVPEFEFNDEDYLSFKNFIADKDFNYTTQSEEGLKDLIEVAKEEKYYDVASDELLALEKKLAPNKEKDLEVFRKEIIRLVSEEIISRYYFQKGRMQYILIDDPAVQKAIEVINDKEKYNAILNPAKI